MKKALIFLILTIMMVVVTTTISQTHEVYAENKAKDLCSLYEGEWSNGKCKIKNDEDKTDYEDELCDDAKDTKKYAKICKGNSDYLNN
jgi:hypothetical protein